MIIWVFIFLLTVNSWAVSDENIPYVTNGGPQQQLDVYLPSDSGFATIIFFHEGSLTSGDKADNGYPAMCKNFSASGIACVAANYRLAPENKWPIQPLDVAAAAAWVKKNIKAMGGDPNRIFLFGHSSGCMLTALVATDEGYLRKFGLSSHDISGTICMGCLLNDHVDTTGLSSERVKQVFQTDPYESIFGSVEVRNDANPYMHVGAHVSPVLILIAESEQFEPPILEQANQFADAARKVGVVVDVEVLPNRKHYTAIQEMVNPNDPTFLLIRNFVLKSSKP